MKKRIFSILLCLCMVLLLLPMTALAESEGSFEYSISATSEVTITGYTGSAAEIAIPDTIDSKPVTSIGNRAFENCSNLTSVTIPDSVTSIGDFAFLACAGLKSITIPDSVTSIGDSAFYQCFGLDSLIIPDSVTSIGNGTFKYCGGLTSISISDKITSIGKGTFYYCRKLTSVNIPNGVTSIGNEAFFTCESLTSISIPASVTSIGNEAFKYCGGLTSIDIPDSVTSIGNEAFKYCGGLESIFLPEGLDVTSASIPNTTSQVKYSLDAEKGEVTITGITLGTDNTSVAIPATICGYPVTSVSDDSLLTIISSHTCAGGQATCQNKAICGICKQEYGEPAAHTAGNDDGDCSTPVYCIYHPDTVVVAAKSHDFSGDWNNDGTGHWHICQNDGCTVAETETPHSCTDDGDCTTAVICECGYVITAANAEHSYGEWQSNGNNTHTRRCTVTGCNGYEDGNCTGGTATCTSKAICEYCKTEYGELANHSLSKTDAKDATCTEDGNTAYWTCSVCHKLFSDEDGTNETMLDAVTIKAAHKLTKTEAKDATCTEDGNTAYWTCSVCHKLFSDEKGTIETTLEAVTIKAAHKLTKTEARNATVTETGNIEYWQCQDCGDIFSDPDGKNEITLEDTVIAKLPPKIIEGTGQSVTAGEKKALSFRSNAAFSDFIRVELDGKTLDEKNYTVKEGSTVVTLKADYVATLSAGEHTIGIVSESGTATTTFTVNAKAVVDNDTKSPQTGDNSHMALWIALLFMSGAGVIGTMVYGKKKRAK